MINFLKYEMKLKYKNANQLGILKLFLLIFLVLFSSCFTKEIVNRKVINTDNEPMMIGLQTQSNFLSEDFSNWFLAEYESYKPDSVLIRKMRKKLKGCRVDIFMGTWCSDSRREVPRFLKIMDMAEVNKGRINIYAVNKNKESFYGEEVGKNIFYVPTFIFYKYENELNRIVETPRESLEADIYKIINNEPYIPQYSF